MSRYLVVCVCIFIDLYSTIFASSSNPSNIKKVTVTAYKLAYNDFVQTNHVIALCKHIDSVDYYAQNEGQIDYLQNFPQNEIIAKDTLIIGINSVIFKNNLELAHESFAAAEKHYQKDFILFQKNIITEETLDKSKIDYQKKLYEKNMADKSYKENLIRAEFEGKVGSINLKLKDYVQKGQFLFSLIKDYHETEKVIFIEVSEKLYNKITNTSEFTFYDLDNIKRYANIVSSSSYLSDKGVIQIKLTANKEANLMHKSYFNLDVVFNKHQALAIPEQSVLRDSGGHYIYKILDNGHLEKLYIKISTPHQGMVELISNDQNQLKEGDTIILGGVNKVHSNSIVEIQ